MLGAAEKVAALIRAQTALHVNEAAMGEALGVDRPYPPLDVEPRMVKRSEDCFQLRQVMAEIARAEWLEGTVGGPAELLPLPPLMDQANCRVALRRAQLGFPPLQLLVHQKRADWDPKLSKQVKHSVVLLKPVEALQYRLSPEYDVLEKKSSWQVGSSGFQ